MQARRVHTQNDLKFDPKSVVKPDGNRAVPMLSPCEDRTPKANDDDYHYLPIVSIAVNSCSLLIEAIS